MAGDYQTLKWQESKNGITVDCSLEIAVHPAKSKTILLIVPGVDGSVDGYEDKYVKMAAKALAKGYGVVRMSNPFISSLHWEENLRHALEFVDDNCEKYFGDKEVELSVIGHSAGASVAAAIAWEYPNITQLILINPAAKLKPEKTIAGLDKFGGQIDVIYGSKDPSLPFSDELPEKCIIHIVQGADHMFSGDYLKDFIDLPLEYLR